MGSTTAFDLSGVSAVSADLEAQERRGGRSLGCRASIDSPSRDVYAASLLKVYRNLECLR